MVKASVTATFMSGPAGADDWILPHKLETHSLIADRVCVVLDRSPGSEEICKRFPKVEVRHVDSAPESLGMRHDGPTWSEGLLRQVAWDFAVESDPDWVLFGDSDEVPEPSIVQMIEQLDPRVDCYYADWINLVHDAGHAIGGNSPWSYQLATSNKKGLLHRHIKGHGYSYDTRLIRHCRMEPNPVNHSKAIIDTTHKMGTVPLIHYRWANWRRWLASDMAPLPKYQPWPPAGCTVVDVPRSRLWMWDADEMLRDLPEPIAVVGNGPCVGAGAEIDAAATVIRFNNFVTTGYEPHVGSKTTHWASNCWDDVTPRPWTLPMFTVYTDAEQPHKLNRWLGMYPHMRRPVTSWHEAARRFKSHQPTTGLVTLARLRQHGKAFKAFGFTGLAGGHYWNPAHKHNHTGEAAALRALGVV